MGDNYDLLDTTAIVSPMVPLPGNHLTSSGHPIWCEEDGVHLSTEAYSDVAGAIADAANGGEEIAAGESASDGSDSATRRRLDSVVTLPAEPPPRPKRGQ